MVQEKGCVRENMELHDEFVGSRLPCRGCKRDCSHYEICDGRPWRTLQAESVAKRQAQQRGDGARWDAALSAENS